MLSGLRRAALRTAAVALGRRAHHSVPRAVNEPVRAYRRGSAERAAVLGEVARMRAERIAVPLVIGGQRVAETGEARGSMAPPHDHRHELGTFARAGEREMRAAIDAALGARHAWAAAPFETRAACMLRAAELLRTKYRATLCAATVLAQSKNLMQAEIDAACELIDFWAFNVEYAARIQADQPDSAPGVWNRLEYRGLEGFVYAATPFNFTAIAGNLPTAPALMGNVAVWKPSDSAIFSNWVVMQILEEAGFPAGVINFVPGDAATLTRVALGHRDLAGLHYTGSTAVMSSLFGQIGENVARGAYRTFPRIVGETGGKDFVIAHPSADAPAVATALSRGAFEYAGQKCSAASRAYVPASMWPAVRALLCEHVAQFKVGNPEEPDTMVNAVINRAAFERLRGAIATIGADARSELVCGGKCDDSVGYFVHPTVARVTDPKHALMATEFFGPLLTVFVYPDAEFGAVLKTCDETSPYALTGSIFARDRAAVEAALAALVHAAGNFYINDKPTGAVVGQQPFGGARMSGTDDKAGSPLNLLRWVAPRTIKETLVPPTDPFYPYMKE